MATVTDYQARTEDLEKALEIVNAKIEKLHGRLQNKDLGTALQGHSSNDKKDTSIAIGNESKDGVHVDNDAVADNLFEDDVIGYLEEYAMQSGSPRELLGRKKLPEKQPRYWLDPRISKIVGLPMMTSDSTTPKTGAIEQQEEIRTDTFMGMDDEDTVSEAELNEAEAEPAEDQPDYNEADVEHNDADCNEAEAESNEAQAKSKGVQATLKEAESSRLEEQPASRPVV